MKKSIIQDNTIEYAIKQVKDGAKKPRLLLHACCGPCSTSVLEYLMPYFDITTFFYNPNIMPQSEFIVRLDALKKVISHFDTVNLIVPQQSNNEYLSLVEGMHNIPEGGSRCTVCFTLRLNKTAQYLVQNKNKYDCFATTLTVSPHKNASLINSIGNAIADEFEVNYLSSNFKKRNGYLRSTELCREWDIYRQTYCGCNF